MFKQTIEAVEKTDMNINDYVNCDNLDRQINSSPELYLKAKPFPHIVLDGFLQEKCITETLLGFENVDWAVYAHYNEKKSGNRSKDFDPRLKSTIDALNSAEFIQRLENLTGITGLIADPELGSGGVHRSTRDGFLNIHADFTVHPYNKRWHRRINVLVYLNETWDENWGGSLEFWDKSMERCVQKIAPNFNRCVIFNTDYDSYHGHPDPMTCPKDVWRKSIALYYYTLAEPHVRNVATNYKGRPEDTLMKKAMISVDRALLSLFHYLKGKFNLSDNVVTKIFGLFNSK